MDASTLLHHAEVVLGNPFERDDPPTAAEAALSTSAPGVIEELAAAGRDKEARRIAMATALVELAAGRAPGLLDPKNRLGRTLQGIGLSTTSVAETAAAAVRCARVLDQLAGVSIAAKRVRSAAWRACFGESVYEAVRLRPFIREQNVLLLGETGTGKELIARAIAAADPHFDRAQAINAAAIPAELIESELFGHVSGAFTGAKNDRQGKITAADGATLFLDEIADLPSVLQAKLLRVLEEHRLTPLGSNTRVPVDVRYLCATSQPLESLVEEGRFRLDLYQRLAGIVIEIPPLRDRLEDLRPITDHLFERYAQRLSESSAQGDAVSTAHLSRLTTVQARFSVWLEREGAEHPWNGNVRELQSMVRRWVLGFAPTPRTGRARSAGDSAVAAAEFPAELARFVDAEGSLRELEDWYISHVVAKVGYKQRRAAKVLGIDRGTLARRLKQIEEI